MTTQATTANDLPAIVTMEAFGPASASIVALEVAAEVDAENETAISPTLNALSAPSKMTAIQIILSPAGQRLINQVRAALQNPESVFYMADYAEAPFGDIADQALAFYAARPTSPFTHLATEDLYKIQWNLVWKEGRQAAEHWDSYPAENPVLQA